MWATHQGAKKLVRGRSKGLLLVLFLVFRRARPQSEDCVFRRARAEVYKLEGFKSTSGLDMFDQKAQTR